MYKISRKRGRPAKHKPYEHHIETSFDILIDVAKKSFNQIPNDYKTLLQNHEIATRNLRMHMEKIVLVNYAINKSNVHLEVLNKKTDELEKIFNSTKLALNK